MTVPSTQQQGMPSLDEILARLRPSERADDAIVQEGGLLIWKSKSDLVDDDVLVLFDGDYRDVLAPDDPEVLAQRAQIRQSA